jgi:hypothetical protein
MPEVVKVAPGSCVEAAMTVFCATADEAKKAVKLRLVKNALMVRWFMVMV